MERTPVMRSAAFDARCGREVYFKCENLQKGGSFKLRGAMNAVLCLPERGRGMSVATHSSGNHGTALALAARAHGLRATVVAPRDSARPKLAAIERAGARVVLCDPGLAAREAALADLQLSEPAHVVHPFEDPDVIAGQGTAALELLAEFADLEVVSVPIGGGGLIGGTAIAVKEITPGCRVIGAEPEQADDASRSFRTGTRVGITAPKTIADGLRGSIGALNFILLQRLVDDVVTVSERDIIAAMRIVLQDLKLLIEPSSAVPVAALLAGAFGSARRIGIVLSGGNVDLEACPFLRGDAR
ncbi:MAG: threonine ammonia-lyase [Steroidobacteraceae bacterium]